MALVEREVLAALENWACELAQGLHALAVWAQQDKLPLCGYPDDARTVEFTPHMSLVEGPLEHGGVRKAMFVHWREYALQRKGRQVTLHT